MDATPMTMPKTLLGYVTILYFMFYYFVSDISRTRTDVSDYILLNHPSKRLRAGGVSLSCTCVAFSLFCKINPIFFQQKKVLLVNGH